VVLEVDDGEAKEYNEGLSAQHMIEVQAVREDFLKVQKEF
jgi:hypothetical protein